MSEQRYKVVTANTNITRTDFERELNRYAEEGYHYVETKQFNTTVIDAYGDPRFYSEVCWIFERREK